MNKYAIFVALSGNVIHEFIPFINSLDFFGNKVDLIVLYWNLSQEFRQFVLSKNWSFNVRFVPLEVDKSDKRLEKIKYKMCVYRFRQMAKLGKNYAACVLMDIDMVLMSNIEDILEMAQHENILGVKNARSVTYELNDKIGYIDYETKESFVKRAGTYWNNICAIPLFLNVNIHSDLLEYVTATSKRAIKDDYQILNFCIHQMKKSKYVIPMENALWIGTEMSWFKEIDMQILQRTDRFDTRYRSGHCIVTHKAMFVRTLHCHWWYNPLIDDAITYRIRKVFKELNKYLTGQKELSIVEKKDEDGFVQRKLQMLNKIIKPQFRYFFNNGKMPSRECVKFFSPAVLEKLKDFIKVDA